MDNVVIASAEDMCRLLRNRSPHEAAGFATAMHERACAGYDQGWTDFWHDVAAAFTDGGLNKPSCGAEQGSGTHHD